MNGSAFDQATVEFDIPGTGGNYASEVVYLVQRDRTTLPKSMGEFDRVTEVQVNVISLPAGASVQIDLLKPGGDPEVAGHWRLDVVSLTALGLAVPQPLPQARGVRVRGKSGGTSGTAEVDIYWQ